MLEKMVFLDQKKLMKLYLLRTIKKKGLNIVGPISPDIIFREAVKKFDLVIANIVTRVIFLLSYILINL